MELPYATAKPFEKILVPVKVHCVPFVEYAILCEAPLPTATHLSEPYVAPRHVKNGVVPRPVHCVPL